LESEPVAVSAWNAATLAWRASLSAVALGLSVLTLVAAMVSHGSAMVASRAALLAWSASDQVFNSVWPPAFALWNALEAIALTILLWLAADGVAWASWELGLGSIATAMMSWHTPVLETLASVSGDAAGLVVLASWEVTVAVDLWTALSVPTDVSVAPASVTWSTADFMWLAAWHWVFEEMWLFAFVSWGAGELARFTVVEWLTAASATWTSS